MEVLKQPIDRETVLPYIVEQLDLTPAQRTRLWWELAKTPLPAFTRWILIKTSRAPRRIKRPTATF